ncbi:hypothetical protein F2P81_025527 [Scophthalmus maximus]|uniref:Reverse transcriptase domain-containing protein n=1 Tax=Scophthalmus maximus TaxID=52904 RepID=A0A6A4RID4_SCOMX|nr:hypothetical protein F2P81_025527 [Scophthalmus maximus]
MKVISKTHEFVNKIQTIAVPSGAMLFTVDIDTLYTNINTKLGLKAVSQVFDRHPDSHRPDEALLQLLELGLTRNDFVFDSKFYLQIHGTAMGKRFAPAYANINMADWEGTLLPKCLKTLFLYVRYLDDIWGIWTHSRDDFEEFLTTVNNHNSSITIKSSVSDTSVDFLDTTTFKHSDFQETHRLKIKTPDIRKALMRCRCRLEIIFDGQCINIGPNTANSSVTAFQHQTWIYYHKGLYCRTQYRAEYCKQQCDCISAPYNHHCDCISAPAVDFLTGPRGSGLKGSGFLHVAVCSVLISIDRAKKSVSPSLARL